MLSKDDLVKQIDMDALLNMDRYAGGHDAQMKGLIKGAKVITHWNSGDYQGQVATCIRIPSGEFVIYNDYYGSCSGCDAWEDATDEQVKKMCNDLVYSSYIFDRFSEVLDFLNKAISKESGNYSWDESCAEPLLNELMKEAFEIDGKKKS